MVAAFPSCCARAARSHPSAAAPPSSVMNSRRLVTRSPRRPPRAAWPCSRAAEQGDELAPFPLMEMHPIPHGPERGRKDIGLQQIGQRLWKASPQGSPRTRSRSRSFEPQQS
jgi:hypothetical protein